MTYIALARHWRPRSFQELLGQDFIKKTLTQTLQQNRLHHAYLFTGTRGVGKTSLARLFAKALNCVQGITPSPCLNCENCLAIEQGRFVDLFEIDGASRTKVEDIRDLLENVPYAPVTGRFKIYLIDEVHMLSQHSFNALLKTLEEPPEQVKFLFATTDPQKIPATILSRCIQFNLKPLEKPVIASHLETILNTESLHAEEGALDLIASAAQGSMRDALSILEQIISYVTESEPTISLSTVKNVLGYTQLDYTHTILEALATEDAEALLTVSQKISAEGALYRHVLETLLSKIHQLACCQLLPPDSPLNPCPTVLIRFATHFEAETLQLFYQITLKGLNDLVLAPTPAVGFEMTLIRLLAFQPSINSTLIQEDTFNLPKPQIETESPKSIAKPPVVDWLHLISSLPLSGLAQHAAEQTEFVSLEHSTLTANVKVTHRSLFTPSIVKQLEASLSQALNQSLKLTLIFKEQITQSPAQHKQRQQQESQQQALDSLKQDRMFQELQNQFDCEIVKVDVTPQ